MTIFSFLRNITRSVIDDYPELRDAKTWDEHVAAGLRGELKRCPVCLDGFKSHQFACFASVRIGRGYPAAEPFHSAVKSHKWDEVLKHQDGEQQPDNAEACAVKCPRGNLALLLIHTTFEPWDYPSIDFSEVLSRGEADTLKNIIPDEKWKPLERPDMPGQ
jgi:hypothetical protein